MRSVCCQRAYDEGVKEGLRQAIRERVAEREYRNKPRDLTARLGDTSNPKVRERLKRCGIF